MTKKLQDTVVEEVEVAEVETKAPSKASNKKSKEVEASIPVSDISNIISAVMDNMPSPAPAQEHSVPLENRISQETRVLEANRKKLANTFATEDKIAVIISPSYRPYLGKTASFSINGIAIYVPCDGQTHMVNASHAALIRETLSRYDKDIARQQRLSNVSNNIDSDPGVPKV